MRLAAGRRAAACDVVGQLLAGLGRERPRRASSSVTSQRSRSGRSTVIRMEPERLVGEDLHLLALREVAVEAGDLVDLRRR